MEHVTVRLYAAARSAVGESEITVQSESLKRILNLISLDSPLVSQVFAQCSFLVDGVVVHDESEIIPAGSTLDILPPFAGG